MSLHWESFVYAIVAFLILYWLLNKFAFGPLFGIMEKRRLLVQEQMDNAEKNRLESEKFLEEQKQSLQQARKEAYDIIEQAKTTGSKQADEIVNAAREESSRLKNEAVREIESEKNKAVAALRSEVTGLSVKIASKIIEKQVDEKAQGELVDKYLQEVGTKP
ncbi:F0F1 ATP synthase subunit B [Cohnella thailandensis]|jgi:ATP synthase, F0 subunit b|uniref:ATP synthase subunit b n=1 Tax=Cohnella thailandensis TaxID=557557 RepID=A0A841T538_9BACL|nr:F0F1 ATP synthase subunit B [Cohnella thailandensis]MBB6638089.1 F0F1 ATP synthase subunit B [Cohnella thailandensis]MBP1971985.1 F-type H+-transporting ATPase subunit b [Cohnella thailandensis]